METQIQSVILNKEAILKKWETRRSRTRKYSKVRKTPGEQTSKLVWEPEWYFVLPATIFDVTLSGEAGDVRKKRLKTILEGYELKDVCF